jgi:hypothetical protein
MRWPYDKRAEAAHAWGAIGVGAAGVIGIWTVLATLHANEPNFRWWWPTNWTAVPLALVALGVMLLLIPIRRSTARNPGPEARGVSAGILHAGSPQAVRAPDVPPGTADATGAGGGEMVYDIRLNPVKDILVHYIYQSADIRMIAAQAGLELGSIAAEGAAVNYWHAVLERACIEGFDKVDAVLDCAIHLLKRTVAEEPLRDAVREYRRDRS